MNLAAEKRNSPLVPMSQKRRKLYFPRRLPHPFGLEHRLGGNVVKIGGETVLFRHEKTFVNPPGIALLVSDAMPRRSECPSEEIQRLEV